MIRREKIGTIAGAAVIMGLGGCNGTGIKAVEIDGHSFRVPEEHLVQGTIPWLPASQSAGLKFVVNPVARSEDQLMFTIESTATTCQPTNPPTSNMLSSACIEAKKNSSVSSVSPFSPEKVHPQDDPTQWAYRVKDAGGNYRTVATCFALSDDKSGLCRSLNNYKDLVYSVGLRDSEIQRLPEIWAKVGEMLASWEVGPAAKG